MFIRLQMQMETDVVRPDGLRSLSQTLHLLRDQSVYQLQRSSVYLQTVLLVFMICDGNDGHFLEKRFDFILVYFEVC